MRRVHWNGVGRQRGSASRTGPSCWQERGRRRGGQTLRAPLPFAPRRARHGATTAGRRWHARDAGMAAHACRSGHLWPAPPTLHLRAPLLRLPAPGLGGLGRRCRDASPRRSPRRRQEGGQPFKRRGAVASLDAVRRHKEDDLAGTVQPPPGQLFGALPHRRGQIGHAEVEPTLHGRRHLVHMLPAWPRGAHESPCERRRRNPQPAKIKRRHHPASPARGAVLKVRVPRPRERSPI